MRINFSIDEFALNSKPPTGNTVTLEAASTRGTYEGSPTHRSYDIELFLEKAAAQRTMLNGKRIEY